MSMAQHWEALRIPLPRLSSGPFSWQAAVKTQLSLRGGNSIIGPNQQQGTAVARKIEIYEPIGIDLPVVRRLLRRAGANLENARVWGMLQTAPTASEAVGLPLANPHGGEREDRRVLDTLLPGEYLFRLNRTSAPLGTGAGRYLEDLGLNVAIGGVAKHLRWADHQAFGSGTPAKSGGSTHIMHRGIALEGAEVGLSVPLLRLPFGLSSGSYGALKVGTRKVYAYTVSRSDLEAHEAGLTAMRPSRRRLARNPIGGLSHVDPLERLARRDERRPASEQAVQRELLITDRFRERETVLAAGFPALSMDITNRRLDSHLTVTNCVGATRSYRMLGHLQVGWPHVGWQDFESSGMRQDLGAVFLRQDRRGRATRFGPCVFSAARMVTKGYPRAAERNQGALDEYAQILGPFADKVGLRKMKPRPQYWHNLQVAVAGEGMDALLDGRRTTPQVIARALSSMADPRSPTRLETKLLAPANPVSFRDPDRALQGLRRFSAMQRPGAATAVRTTYDLIYREWGRRKAHDFVCSFLPALLRLQQKIRGNDPRVRDVALRASGKLLARTLSSTSLLNNHGKVLTARFLLEVLDQIGLADAANIRLITVHTQGRGKNAVPLTHRNFVTESWYGGSPRRGTELFSILSYANAQIYGVTFLP